MIAFGGALLIATSLAPGLAADVAWSWLSAGTAGLSSAVAFAQGHKRRVSAAGRSAAPGDAGEPLFVLSVLRDREWIETSAAYTSVEQAGHAASAIRQKLGWDTAISVLDPRFAVSTINPRGLAGADSPAVRG
jgi:hypothetical protein